MDSSLMLLHLAQNFLATSPEFEPKLPQSHRNIYVGLKILNVLGEITQQSLKDLKDKPSTDTQTKPLVHSSFVPGRTEYQPALRDQAIVQALLDLQKKQQLATPSSQSRSQKNSASLSSGSIKAEIKPKLFHPRTPTSPIFRTYPPST